MAYEKMEEDFIVSVSTGGDNTNGGFFAYNYSSAGVDRTDQDDPYVNIESSGTVTAYTVAGSGSPYNRKIALSGYTVSADDIGNAVQTNATGSGSSVHEGMLWIKAVDTVANTWEFNYEVRGSGADYTPEAVVGKMGGSLADPFFYRSKMQTWYSRDYIFNIFLKSGTYTAAAGNALDSSAITYMPYSERWFGYTTTRGDHREGGARPIIDIPSSLNYTGTVLKMPDQWASSVTFLEIHCGGQASVGIKLGGYHCVAYSCVVKDCDDGTGAAPYPSAYYGTGFAVNCHAEDCEYGYFYNINCEKCTAKGCYTGFFLNYSKDRAANCIAWDCTLGFNLSNGDAYSCVNCVAYNCSGQGMIVLNRGSAFGCGAHSCGSGFHIHSYAGALLDCWAYNNTTNYHTGADNYVNVGVQTLTADPFEDASSGDFRLNSAAAGGALLAGKGVGIGGNTQTSYEDIHAFVTEPSGGGGGGTTVPQGLHSIESGINA